MGRAVAEPKTQLGLPGPRRKGNAWKERDFASRAVEEEELGNHIRPQGELGPAASITSR